MPVLDVSAAGAVAFPPDHAAKIYTDIDELAQTVATYLAVGFDLGDPALVVATPEHCAAFAAALAAGDWTAARLEHVGLLFVEDAESILTAVTSGGDGPFWTSFEAKVGSAFDRVAERFPDRPIRVFGEVVNLLCERGDAEGAAVLEQHWNRLAETRRFSLLCGYQLDPFDRSAQVSVLPAVCRAHSHVLPAGDPARFQQAVDWALEDALGRDAGKVYALIGDQARKTSVPEAQLALMWVSTHMPASAERILEAARTNYASAAPA